MKLVVIIVFGFIVGGFRLINTKSYDQLDIVLQMVEKRSDGYSVFSMLETGVIFTKLYVRKGKAKNMHFYIPYEKENHMKIKKIKDFILRANMFDYKDLFPEINPFGDVNVNHITVYTKEKYITFTYNDCCNEKMDSLIIQVNNLLPRKKDDFRFSLHTGKDDCIE